MDCALAAQAELRGDTDLRLRVGIHHGDVTFDAAGVSGDGVSEERMIPGSVEDA